VADELGETASLLAIAEDRKNQIEKIMHRAVGEDSEEETRHLILCP
jgi:hypothetical protein